MTDKRRASAPLPGSSVAAPVAAPSSEKRSSSTNGDYLRTPKSSSPILKRSHLFNALVIQLSLDAGVRSIRYVDSLVAMGRRVKVEMLLAERDDGLFALELVDERPTRDLDNEGLVLIGLEEAGAQLLEVDQTQLNEQPLARNCLFVWENRSHPVDASTRAAIVRTLRKQGPTPLRKLAELAGVSYPLKAICTLAWKGIVTLDLSNHQLDLDTEVTVASDRRRPANSAPTPSNRGP